MPAYMVAQYRSSQEYAAYRTAVADLNRKYGARILTQSGTARCIEGEWNHDSMVIIEFASLAVAQQFYQSLFSIVQRFLVFLDAFVRLL